MKLSKKNKLNSKGFSHVEMLLVVVLVVALASVGYYVYKHEKNSTNTAHAGSLPQMVFEADPTVSQGEYIYSSFNSVPPTKLTFIEQPSGSSMSPPPATYGLDGSVIFYMNKITTNETTLNSYSATGNKVLATFTSPSAYVSYPAVVWSESAQKIAVIEDETNIKTSTYTEVIYTISPQGTDLSKIFQGDMYSGPVWSPNGKLLAVELMGTNGAENTTVIMNANGSDQHTLTLGCSGYISWTPNSASIVCPGDGPAIYVENVNSTEAYVEVPASVLTPGTAFGSAAALSPNGTQVVYTTYPYAKTATAGRVEIYTLATKSNKDVYGYTYSRTSNNYIDMVSWSPDSQQVAFAYFGVLFTVNNNGAGLRILDKMPYLSGIDWTTQ